MAEIEIGKDTPLTPTITVAPEITGRDFGRLEGKVDSILREVQDMKKDGNAIHGDVETRLRVLERWRYGIPVAGLLALITVFTNWFPVT